MLNTVPFTRCLQLKNISDELHRLTFRDGRELYLIGTTHVSKASVDLVEKMIHEVKPDTVCVELDDKRLKAIMKNVFDDLDIIKIISTRLLSVIVILFITATITTIPVEHEMEHTLK